MIKFRDKYSSTSEFVSESGSPYLDQYAFDFDEKGEVKRTTLHKIDDPINVYERIQADYPSTDINLLMQKFDLGDSSALNVREGVYADVSKMPSNMAELFAKVQEGEKLFNALPPEVKQLFDNSSEEFWYEYGSKEFNEKIDEYNDRFVDHEFDIPDDDPKGDDVGE